MKKITLLIAISGMFAFTACDPGAKEIEQTKLDSVAKADSIAKAEADIKAAKN